MRKKTRVLLVIAMAAAALCCGCGKNANTGALGAVEEPAAADQTETAAVEDVAESEADSAAESAADGTDLSAQSGTDEAAADADIESTDAAQDAQDADTATGDASDEVDYSKRDLFADFLRGVGSAVVADDFVDETRMDELGKKPGQTFDAYELLLDTGEDGLVPNAKISSSYAPLECHGKIAYALKHYYESDRENVTTLYVFIERGDKLEMVMALDGWSRRGFTINENGVIFDGGSNGAGSHVDTVYAPDENFSYKMVSDLCEQYYSYDFYDENGNPIEGLNATMKEACEGEVDPMEVVFYSEAIDGKTYYYFLGTGKLTQKTVDYIDGIASTHNFRFDGKAAADEARNAYEEKLGVTEACKNEKQPQWTDLG